jgi:hypothetical protein
MPPLERTDLIEVKVKTETEKVALDDGKIQLQFIKMLPLKARRARVEEMQ